MGGRRIDFPDGLDESRLCSIFCLLFSKLPGQDERSTSRNNKKASSRIWIWHSHIYVATPERPGVSC
jgi:hypothetical protein